MTHHWIVFECGHSAALLAEEFGDGSAWCQQCADFQVYQDADDAADAANDALFVEGGQRVFVTTPWRNTNALPLFQITRSVGQTIIRRDHGKWYPEAYALLEELQSWFENEVAAGDTALQHWLDKIAAALGDDAGPRPGDSTVLGS